MKRYWISWIQNTMDFRPMTDPPGSTVLGWWKSGEFDDGRFAIVVTKAILCAVVEARTEVIAQKIILTNWETATSEVESFRFCEEKPKDWKPGNRFPISEAWSKERFGETK